MKPYLIVLDLDGTLMSGFNSYDEETFNYLRLLSKEGHIIMLATGRPFRSSFFVYQELQLNTPIINYNGALVTNPTDPSYPKTDLRISRNDLLEIIRHIEPFLINVFCEINDDIYVLNYNQHIHSFLHLDGGNLYSGPLSEILPDHPHGALFFLKPDYVNNFNEYINHKYTGRLLSRYWQMDNDHIVEIYNPQVDKKNGLIQAIKYYNIPIERTIAFGDGHNDIGLFQTSTISVAMGNCHQELLKFATHQTDDCQNQGILKFLKNYFNKKTQI